MPLFVSGEPLVRSPSDEGRCCSDQFRSQVRDLTGHFLQFSEQEYRKRPNPLSITHKFSAKGKPQLDVGQAGQTSPNDRVSGAVNASVGEASGTARFIIVSQKILQLRMQKTAIKLVSRWAVRSRDSSALQPDFRIL